MAAYHPSPGKSDGYFRHGERDRHEGTEKRRRREKWISNDVNSAFDLIRDGSDRSLNRLRERNKNKDGNNLKGGDYYTTHGTSRVTRNENVRRRHPNHEYVSPRYRRHDNFPMFNGGDNHHSLREHDYGDDSDRDSNIREGGPYDSGDVGYIRYKIGRDSRTMPSPKYASTSVPYERRSKDHRMLEKEMVDNEKRRHILKKEKKSKRSKKKKSKAKEREKHESTTARFDDSYYEANGGNFDDEREGGYRSGASVTSRFLTKGLERIRNLATSSNGDGKIEKSYSDRQLGNGDWMEDANPGQRDRTRRKPSVSMHGTPSTDANFFLRELEKKKHKSNQHKGNNHSLNRSLTRLSDALALNLTRHDRPKNSDIRRLLEQHQKEEVEVERKPGTERGRRIHIDEMRCSAVTAEISNRSRCDRGIKFEAPESSEDEYFERPRSPSRTAVERYTQNYSPEHGHSSERRDRSDDFGHPDVRVANSKGARKVEIAPPSSSERHRDTHAKVKHYEHPETPPRMGDFQHRKQGHQHEEIQLDVVGTFMNDRKQTEQSDCSSVVSGDAIKLSTLMYHREWDAVHVMLFDEGTDVDGYHQSKDKAMDIVELSCFEGEQGSNLLHVICRHQPPLHIVFDICHEWPWMALQPDYSNRRFPLHLACLYGCQSSVVLYLLDLYVDAAMKRDSLGCVPLHYACRPIRWTPEPVRSASAEPETHEELEPSQLIRPGMAVVEALCDVEPQAVHVPDNKGRTPLHWGIQEGVSKGICKVLVSAAEMTLSEPHESGETLSKRKDNHGFYCDADHNRANVIDAAKLDDDISVGTGVCTHISIGGSRHGRRDPKLHLFLSKNSGSDSFRSTEQSHSRQRLVGASKKPKENLRHLTGSGASHVSLSERSNKSTKSHNSLASRQSRQSRRNDEDDHISASSSASRSRRGRNMDESAQHSEVDFEQRGSAAEDNDDDSLDLNYIQSGNRRGIPLEESMSSLETATQRWNENYGDYRSDEEENSSTGASSKARKRVGGRKKERCHHDLRDLVMDHHRSDNRVGEDEENHLKEKEARSRSSVKNPSGLITHGGSSNSSTRSSGPDEELLYQNSEKQDDPPRRTASDSQNTITSLDASSNTDRDSHNESASDEGQDNEHLVQGEVMDVVEDKGIDEDHLSYHSTESFGKKAETESTNNHVYYERGRKSSRAGEKVSGADHGRLHKKLVKKHGGSQSKGIFHSSSPESLRSSMAVYRGKKGKNEHNAKYSMEVVALGETASEEGCSSSESVGSSIAVAAAHVVAAFPDLGKRGDGEAGSSLDIADPDLTRRIAELFASSQGHIKSSKSTASARYRFETAGVRTNAEMLELLRKQRSLPSMNVEDEKSTTQNDSSPRRTRKGGARGERKSAESKIAEGFEHRMRQSNISKKHHKSSLSGSWSRVSDDQIRDLLKHSRKRSSSNTDLKSASTGQSVASNKRGIALQPTKTSPASHVREERLRDLLKDQRQRRMDDVSDHRHREGRDRSNRRQADTSELRSTYSQATELRDNSTAAILRKHQKLQQAMSAADKKRNEEQRVLASRLLAATPRLQRRDTASSDNTTETESSSVQHKEASRERSRKSNDDSENAPSSTGETSAGG